MAKPPIDIVAEIVASLPQEGTALPWWRRITDEQRQTIAPILVAWRSGRLGKRQITAARAISARLEKLGITIGPQGVLNWLKRG